jgi:hypothetical protein
MEVSNDQSSWVKIDRRSTKELSGSNLTKYFAGNSASSDFYRFVRIRQTNVNYNNTHFLEIGGLEFFGRLRGGKATH